MKKFYAILSSLALGCFGLIAQTVTNIEPWQDPENGIVSQEDIVEIINGWYGGPVVGWDYEALYYNEDSKSYDEYDDAIYVDVIINGETYSYMPQVSGILEYMEYDGERGAATLNIQIGNLWEYLMWDIKDEYLDNTFNMSLVVPKGALFVGENGGDINGEVTLNYKFENIDPAYNNLPGVPDDVEVSPANETYLSFDNIPDTPIQIRWGDGSSIYYNTEYSDNDYGYYDESDNALWVNLYINGGSAYDYVPARIINQSYLEVDVTGGYSWEYIEEWEGTTFTMQILIPEGSLYVGSEDGEPNEAVGITYYVVGDDVDTELSEPKTVLTDENVLYFYWDQEIKVANGGDTVKGVLSLSNGGGENVVLTLTSYNPDNTNYTHNALLLALSPFIEKYGSLTYTVRVWAGEITNADGTAENEVLEWKQAIDASGISVISSENVDAPVYNLQGVKVGNNVNGLNNGIYIINGKKVVVRK